MSEEYVCEEDRYGFNILILRLFPSVNEGESAVHLPRLDVTGEKRYHPLFV